MTKKYDTKSASERLGQLLYEASWPMEFKEAWLSLLPKMTQPQLHELFEHLQADEHWRQEFFIKTKKEMERMKLDHQARLEKVINKIKPKT